MERFRASMRLHAIHPDHPDGRHASWTLFLEDLDGRQSLPQAIQRVVVLHATSTSGMISGPDGNAWFDADFFPITSGNARFARGGLHFVESSARGQNGNLCLLETSAEPCIAGRRVSFRRRRSRCLLGEGLEGCGLPQTGEARDEFHELDELTSAAPEVSSHNSSP